MVTINASGDNGINGLNGIGYVYSHHNQARDGANATNGTPGTNGGIINVVLRTIDYDRIQIFGSYVKNNIEYPINQSFYIDRTVFDSPVNLINLIAKGGNGGNGGNGYDGENGKSGEDGRRASEFFSGTNGTNGQDGGNAGAGTNGQDGGTGGKIHVSVSEEDMYLLVYLNCDVSGGLGGQAGLHGRAGSGGSGGSGGRAYSWTTQELEFCHHKNQEITVTKYHHNPGGSDGSRGRDGQRVNINLKKGNNGNVGELIVSIGNISTSITNNNIYNTVIKKMVIDDVYEFGESIVINKIECENTGKIPTPKFQSIRINPVTSNSLELVRNTAEVFSVLPNKYHKFNGELAFKTKEDSDNVASTRIQQKANMSFKLYIEGTYKYFNNPFSKNITLTYPIELEKIEFIDTLCPGEISKCFINLNNVFMKDFNRKIKLHVYFDDDNDIILYDIENNLPISDKKYNIEINDMKANSKKTLFLCVGLASTAPNYKKITINVELYIEPISNYEKQYKLIQKQQKSFQISNFYIHTNNASILLLTDHLTTSSQIEQFVSLFNNFGIGISIYNTSITGFVDIDWIQNHFKGYGIIALNKTYELINYDNFYNKLTSNSVKLLLDGSDLLATEFYNSQIQNIIDNNISHNLKSQSNLLKAIKDDNFSNYVYEYEFINRYFIFNPKEKDLKNEAIHFASILNTKYPDKQFVICYDYEINKKSNTLYSLGKISVINQGNKFNRKIIPIYNLSNKNFKLNKLLSIIPFRELVRLYYEPKIVSYEKELEDNILTQVIFEIQTFIQSENDNTKYISNNLESFRYLCDIAKSTQNEKIIRIIYVIKNSLYELITGWQLLPFSTIRKIHSIICDLISDSKIPDHPEITDIINFSNYSDVKSDNKNIFSKYEITNFKKYNNDRNNKITNIINKKNQDRQKFLVYDSHPMSPPEYQEIFNPPFNPNYNNTDDTTFKSGINP